MIQNSVGHLFNSEPGLELERLRLNCSEGSIDPSFVKDIIVTREDTRIATRLSEFQFLGLDQEEISQQSQLIQSLRLNLRSGQQCVRDFFVALKENIVNWPDVYDNFEFQMVNSTTSSNCGFRSQSELTQIYEEMEVPPNQSSLKLSHVLMQLI